MVSTTNPEVWKQSDVNYDASNQRCGSSLSRHPSLAEISIITSNCSTSPIMNGENYLDRSTEALNSEIASTEESIALLGSQSRERTMVPATPPKPSTKADSSASTNQGDEPLTPTANLKMLVSAASPAIRDRETKKRELFTEPVQRSPSPCVVPSFALPMFDSKVVYRNGSFLQVNLRDGSETEKMVISRKDKSLGLLCQRFLAKYPENPSPEERIEISLDEVAKDLSVERRRIYDIVNVLESVEVISRFAKNRYMWHGKTKLPQTLAKLKQFAVSYGFTSKGGSTGKENPQGSWQTKCTKAGTSNKLPHLLPKNSKICLSAMGCFPSVFDGEEDAWAKKQREADYCRKDKSLGVLSQKFLMMFLLSETRQVTLDDAANLLIDEEEEGKAKYKTKVRRLYDIANILSSLQLIQKVHIHNIQSGRKPGFRWIGIDLDSLDKLNKPSCTCESDNPAKKKAGNSKNSSVVKEPVDTDESAFGRLISRRPSQQQLRRTRSDSSNKSKLPRSRSDRGFASKKRVLSCDSDNGAHDKEDGYSIQEITGIDDNAMRSPDSAKFHSELMKLKEQYPDRMSQLLSACRQNLLIPEDNKKSRRTLFTGETSTQDGPSSKRRKIPDDVASKENEPAKFVHSSTSPFKPFPTEQNGIDSTTVIPAVKKVIPRAVEGSPEQKILLEREKQKKLLEEQKDFTLKDERWKRMEDELEKKLSKTCPVVSKNNSSAHSDSVHSSVGIQANLIDDVSPLKPLSNYVKNMKPWYGPPDKDNIANLSPVSPSPVSFQSMGITPLVSSPVCEISSPTSVSVVSSNNAQSVHLTSLTSSHLQSLWTMSTCNAPSMQTSQAPVYFGMSQQHVFPSVSKSSLMSVEPSTAESMKLVSQLSSEQHCLKNVLQVTSGIMQPLNNLPVNIISSLNNSNLIQDGITCLKDNQMINPIVNVQPSIPQGFNPGMVMTAMQGIRNAARPHGAIPNQMTPILPKSIAPQHAFSSGAEGTPCNNTSFVHSDIAKKLVMPESKST